MNDMEKAAKGLECCYASFPKLKGCPVCPYEKNCYHDRACDDLLRDTLALLKEQKEEIENLKQTCQSMMEGAYLLKEQEAVKPVNVRWEMGINGGDCPKCMNWVQRTYNYCPFCGKAVKWE